jgi:hypothetical protein
VPRAYGLGQDRAAVSHMPAGLMLLRTRPPETCADNLLCSGSTACPSGHEFCSCCPRLRQNTFIFLQPRLALNMLWNVEEFMIKLEKKNPFR